MNCDDLSPLMDAYLDSELDPRTAMEIQDHLSGCRRCNAAFARAAQFDRQLGSVLQCGDRTPSLWDAIECRLQAGATPDPVPSRPIPRAGQPDVKAAEPWWRFWLWPSPRSYAALAAVWVVLVAIALSNGETATAPKLSATTRSSPPSAAMNLVLAQQHRLRAELLDPSGTTTAPKRPVPPQSRTRSGPGTRTA